MSIPALNKGNNIILNGQVLSSKIDMDLERITSLADPIANADAVTKFYCDTNSQNGIPTVTVTLTSNIWNTILMNTSGTFDIIISNVISDGPCAKFTLAKSGPSRNASIQRWNSCSGTTTNERLEMRWPIGSGIELRKNGNGYDGNYKVRYLSV
jgi:hypothetical protein